MITNSTTSPNPKQPDNFYDDLARLLGNKHVSALDVVTHIQHWLNNEQWLMSLSTSEFDGFMSTVYRALAIVRTTARAESGVE